MSRKTRSRLIFMAIFTLGLLIFSYPLISQKYYEIKAEDEVITFTKAAKELAPEDLDKRMALAAAYNRTLDPSRLADPYTDMEKAGRAEYARMLEVEEMLGHIRIPKIQVDIPIRAGSSEDVLQKGAGHLEGTSLPIGGDSTHTVITAHRGLPNAKLFRNLDQLAYGDIFYITNIKETIAYKVDKIQVVEPSDFEPVLVVERKDYATLLTCTPYMINSHRLLVRGVRIPYQEAIDDGVANTPRARFDFFRMVLVLIPIIIILLLTLFREKKRTDNLSKELREIEERNQIN
ncbi:class C sortase [Anaerococcus murdochii]|uniref:Class C sortase n=1 Tax=Anaerococcus murdochii TaxID=411577 RepID=A0ABS7SX16_9FIRM|nr:class C sortase [Anaerococcus murdochii]MBZ2386060.1 class C sortase [Anaerococcus murdochii]